MEASRQHSGGAPSSNSAQAQLLRYYVAVSSPEAKLGTLMELLTALQHEFRQLSSSGTSLAEGRDRPLHRRLSAVICCSSRDSLDSVTAELLEARGFSVMVMHSDMTEKEWEAQLLLFKGADVGAAGRGAGGAGGPGAAAVGAERGGSPGGSSAVLDEAGMPSSSFGGAGGARGGAGGDGGGGEGSLTGGSRGDLPLPSSVAAAGGAPSSFQQQQQQQRASGALNGGGMFIGAGGPCSAAVAMVLVTTDTCLKAVSKELLPIGAPLLVQYDTPRQKDVYQRRISTVFGGGKERRSTAGRSTVVDVVVGGEVAAFRASEQWFSGVIQELPTDVAELLRQR